MCIYLNEYIFKMYKIIRKSLDAYVKWKIVFPLIISGDWVLFILRVEEDERIVSSFLS